MGREASLASHILAAEPLYPDPESESWLTIGDSELVIITGGNTNLFEACVCLLPPGQGAIRDGEARDELSTVPMGNGFSVRALQDLKHLNAFIMETVRLHAAVPGGAYRSTPPEGLQVGEHYIPGDAEILVPTWSIHRCTYIFRAEE